MEDFESRMREIKQVNKDRYRQSIKKIQDDYGFYYSAHLMAKMWNNMYPSDDLYKAEWSKTYTGASVLVMLQPHQDIEKDVNIFLDEISHLINANCLPEPTIRHDETSVDYTYRTNDFDLLTLCFVYTDAKCKRVKVGTTVKRIEEDIFEFVCD